MLRTIFVAICSHTAPSGLSSFLSKIACIFPFFQGIVLEGAAPRGEGMPQGR